MCSVLIRLILFIVISSLLSSCSRLTYIPVREPLPSFSPPDSEAFQPGDIVLTYPIEPISWLMSFMGSSNPDQLENPYNHGEVVFVDPDGRKMLGGFSGRVMAKPLEERIPLFHRVVVLRHKGPDTDSRKIGRLMARISHDPQYQNATFDYSFRDVPGRKSKFYCLGLINEVHREANAPVPFPHKPIKRNALLAHVEELLDQNIVDGPVIEDIFNNPDYEVVLEWTNNQDKYLDTWYLEHITRYTLDIYEQGWRLRESEAPTVNLFLWLIDDGDESLDSVKRIMWTFKNFHTEAGIDWEKLSTAGKLDGLSERQKMELLETVGNKYRDEFFVKDSAKTLARNDES
ncbi:hypothetical protein SAMN04488073_2447 [Marinobacter gudaonensis]|uniref:Permuted papain-like amidase enzyme, YaeF/YiiX, C92 family n=1 Tax=Marinobacter gudaonensis TaxID=375760 RepID=A0A1I6H729_9GAMM|nr:hypothetical protein SAMN04488073_2447 [Marinobacter gudaonensis]